MRRVLVTGVTGFVGSLVCRTLANAQYDVRRAIRRPSEGPSSTEVLVGDIHGTTDWGHALEGVDAVVHLAARVHVMGAEGPEHLEQFRAVNVHGTSHLAENAARAGVKRFVFMSSVKVNGERTEAHSFTEHMAPVPLDSYGISKWEAEQRLWEIGARTGMEVVSLRPPLVYGPGVRANFLRLLSAVAAGRPLPVGGSPNARTLVFVENLADAVVQMVRHRGQLNGPFLVGDKESVSTKELINRIARAFGKKPRTISLPNGVWRGLATMLRQQNAMGRLLDSLVLDTTHLRNTLDWAPPYSLDEGLRMTADWFGRQHR